MWKLFCEADEFKKYEPLKINSKHKLTRPNFLDLATDWHAEKILGQGHSGLCKLLRLIVQVDLEGEINKATLTHLALEGSSLFVISIVDLEV